MDLVQCGVCSAPHHDDCWADNGGCAVLGCAGAPALVAAAGEAAAPAPRPATAPPAAPRPGGAAGVPPQPIPTAAPPRRSLQPAMIAALALVIVASIAVAALALSANLGGDGSTTSSNPSGTSPAPGDGDGDGPTPRPLVQDRSEISTVLRRYETAYTNHDTESLRFVFTPDATRHGLASGGCRDASGRDAVLDQYRQQFELGTGTYTLRGMAPTAIDVDGESAHTDLRFSIEGGRSGSVSFDLERFENAWRVSRVDSHC